MSQPIRRRTLREKLALRRRFRAARAEAEFGGLLQEPYDRPLAEEGDEQFGFVFRLPGSVKFFFRRIGVTNQSMGQLALGVFGLLGSGMIAVFDRLVGAGIGGAVLLLVLLEHLARRATRGWRPRRGRDPSRSRPRRRRRRGTADSSETSKTSKTNGPGGRAGPARRGARRRRPRGPRRPRVSRPL